MPPLTSDKMNKKTLILDLDETLVHSSFNPPENPDLTLPVEIDGSINHVYVLVRPGTLEFLEVLSEYYEIVIFTASMQKYAEPLM